MQAYSMLQLQACSMIDERPSAAVRAGRECHDAAHTFRAACALAAAAASTPVSRPVPTATIVAGSIGRWLARPGRACPTSSKTTTILDRRAMHERVPREI